MQPKFCTISGFPSNGIPAGTGRNKKQQPLLSQTAVRFTTYRLTQRLIS
ncbi:MAG: hypothetical protein QM689_04945 [Oscillospiraceae bacterium]